jgi:hypothetical protein
MMLRTLRLGLALFAACTASSALACSIEIPPQMTAEERAAEVEKWNREFVEKAKSARAILTVEAITSSGENESSALFEVSKIYKGKHRRGAALKLNTIGTSLCGPGAVKRRERGIIIISREDPRLFNGFVWSEDLKLLVDAGVLPQSVLD